MQINHVRRLFWSTCVDPWAREQMYNESDNTNQLEAVKDETINRDQMAMLTYMNRDNEVDLQEKLRKVPVKKGSVKERDFS